MPERWKKYRKKYDSEKSLLYDTQETGSTDIVNSDDLVYKEYSLGEKFHSSKIVISKEILLSATKEPDTVIIYFNDEILETIAYDDTDIQMDLSNEGMYYFMVVSKDNEYVDITLQVQGISYSESGVDYLKWK